MAPGPGDCGTGEEPGGQPRLSLDLRRQSSPSSGAQHQGLLSWGGEHAAGRALLHRGQLHDYTQAEVKHRGPKGLLRICCGTPQEPPDTASWDFGQERSAALCTSGALVYEAESSRLVGSLPVSPGSRTGGNSGYPREHIQVCNIHKE